MTKHAEFAHLFRALKASAAAARVASRPPELRRLSFVPLVIVDEVGYIRSIPRPPT